MEDGALPKQDGFVQVFIAKVQTQPAKMSIVISSGEDGFGSDQPKIHFIGEKI